MAAVPTGVLFTEPQNKPLSTSGTFQAACYRVFFLTGTTTPAPSYQDGYLQNELTQPVVADSAGRFVPIYLDPNITYRSQLYSSNGSILEDVDPYIPASLGGLTATTLGNAIFPQSDAELAALFVPTNPNFYYGDIRRSNAKLDGVTDDTAAIQSWASVGGQLTWPVAQQGLISATIALPSNTTVNFSQGGGLTTATHDIAFVQATNQTGVEVTGGTFIQTQAGLAGQYLIAGIVFSGCTHCLAERNTFIGMQWCGVLLTGNTLYSTVRGNRIGPMLGILQDAEDIAIIASATAAPAYNIIDGNFCYGGGEHGIGCWNPYTGTSMPSRNTIINNKVGAHTGYGIFVYSGNASSDSFNQITGNEIEGVLGNYIGVTPASNNPSTGAGIYAVGAACGGTQITNNVVRNCCINTGNASLAPAGIGISGTSAGSMPLVVADNVIEGMTQYHGILFTGCLGAGVCSGNAIRMPASNTTGDAIRVANSDSISVTGNTINQLNTTSNQRCILFFAQTTGMSGCSCNGNSITGGHLSQIEAQQTLGNIVTGLTISGNSCVGGDNNCIPILLSSGAVARAMVTGNYCTSGSNPAVQQTSCVAVRYSNNFCLSTGAVDVAFLGTNTDGLYDQTNTGQSTDASINNAGTGLIVEQLTGSAAPAAGTYAQGDKRWYLTPSAGASMGALNTTAGTPGTWKPMPNLGS